MKNKENTKNIYQRIRDVMCEVKAVQKESKKVNGQYTFVSHDGVARALHMPLADHGIVMIPTVSEISENGNRTVAKVDVKFVNVDDPSDCINVIYYGYGIDNQDKGIGKAISYAVKYALLKTFCLETGDDVEKDNIDHSPAKDKKQIEKQTQEVLSNRKITEEELELLEIYLEENEPLRKKILAVIKDRYKAKILQDMPYKAYKQALQSAKLQYKQSNTYENEEEAAQ